MSILKRLTHQLRRILSLEEMTPILELVYYFSKYLYNMYLLSEKGLVFWNFVLNSNQALTWQS